MDVYWGVLSRTKPQQQQAVWPGPAPYPQIAEALWTETGVLGSLALCKRLSNRFQRSRCLPTSRHEVKDEYSNISALFSKQTHNAANATHYYPIIRAGLKSGHTHWFSVFTTPIKPSGVLCWVFISYGIIKSLSLCVAPLLKLKQNAEKKTRRNTQRKPQWYATSVQQSADYDMRRGTQCRQRDLSDGR